jgi:hypothetical protein
MGTKSRETIYGASVRAAAERATQARKEADRLACDAWNKRMLGFQGPAQPPPALGDALNAGYRYLEVRCLGCDTHQTVALDVVRRPKATPIHELERYMRSDSLAFHQDHRATHMVAGRALNDGRSRAAIPRADPHADFNPQKRVRFGRCSTKMRGRQDACVDLFAAFFSLRLRFFSYSAVHVVCQSGKPKWIACVALLTSSSEYACLVQVGAERPSQH